MHIALYSPAWPPSQHSNGIITYVDHLGTELRRRGHKVSILTGVVDDAQLGPDVHRVSTSLSTSKRIQRKLAKMFPGWIEDTSTWGHLIGEKINELHRSEPVDVIEIEESFGWCSTVRRITALPLVVKLHGPAFLDLLDEAVNESGQQKIKAEGKALQQMNFIISPSANTLAETLKHHRLQPALAQTIPDPMVSAEKSDLWALENCDRKTLLFVGRFDLRKGGDIVLQAFKQLLLADPELKLVFVGPDRGVTNSSGDLLHFDDYADTLFSAPEKARVQYLGKLPPAQIPEMRKRAMVTLVTSRWDNQPNTALEAMMQSCPVVAVDAGGVGEIVQHQSTGLLARHNDLCDQISFMLDNPQRAAEMGCAARRVISERHAARTLADATLAVYRQAI